MNTNNHEKSKTIVICSAAGGVGKTTITVNLSACLAARNNRVSVMDADLSFGDLAPAFDLEPAPTLKDAAERNDIKNIQSYFLQPASGGDVLLAPTRPEYAELISPEFLNAIVPQLQADTEWLIIDTGAGLNEINLQLMEKADVIFVIATPAMAVMKNTKLMMETLEMLQLKDKAHVIVNKFTTSTLLQPKKFPSLLHVDRLFYIPRDDKHVDYSLDIGKPLVLEQPKLSFSKEIRELAAVFDTGKTVERKQTDKKQGFLSRLKKNKQQ